MITKRDVIAEFNDYAFNGGPIEDAKTDFMFDCGDFESWSEQIIRLYVEELKKTQTYKRLNTERTVSALLSDSSFMADLRAEYDDLKEILDMNDEDEDEDN